MQVKLATILRVIAQYKKATVTYKKASASFDLSPQNKYLATLFLEAHGHPVEQLEQAIQKLEAKAEHEETSSSDKKKLKKEVEAIKEELAAKVPHKDFGKELEVMKVAVHLDPIKAWPLIASVHFSSPTAMMDLKNIAKDSLVSLLKKSPFRKARVFFDDIPDTFLEDVSFWKRLATDIPPDFLLGLLSLLKTKDENSPVFSDAHILASALGGTGGTVDFFTELDLVPPSLRHNPEIKKKLIISFLKDRKVREAFKERPMQELEDKAQKLKDKAQELVAKAQPMQKKIQELEAKASEWEAKAQDASTNPEDKDTALQKLYTINRELDRHKPEVAPILKELEKLKHELDLVLKELATHKEDRFAGIKYLYQYIPKEYLQDKDFLRAIKDTNIIKGRRFEEE